MIFLAKKSDSIAVFDSGLGGISVLRELVHILPKERFLYFGDSANAPYGTRPTSEVRQLTIAAADKLLVRDVKALVVACNTATAAAVSQLREKYPDVIIIGIEPALKPAVETFPNGHIGIMATPVTLREERLSHQLKRFPYVTTILLPAHGLVELIEAGELDTPAVYALLESLLRPYSGKLDALVLGCTHYPFVKKAIWDILPGKLLLDGSEGTARETKHRLEQAGLLSDGPGSIRIENSLASPEILARSEFLLRK